MINPNQIVNEDKIPWFVPEELIQEILSWETRCKSPYSYSYYNLNPGEKGWNQTPLNSLRISDHWNFHSKDRIHCKTDQPIHNIRYWALGRWDGERYVILKKLQRSGFANVLEKRTVSMKTKVKNDWLQYRKSVDISPESARTGV